MDTVQEAMSRTLSRRQFLGLSDSDVAHTKKVAGKAAVDRLNRMGKSDTASSKDGAFKAKLIGTPTDNEKAWETIRDVGRQL